MEKSFVNKEDAKKLKDLGYNEKVQAYYQEDVDILIPNMITSPIDGQVIQVLTNITEDNKYPAPTLYEVKEWLEKEHKMQISITYNRRDQCYDYSCTFEPGKIGSCGGYFNHTPEEALTKMIQSCIYHLEDRKKGGRRGY